jgi:hypothetical protein
MNKLIATVLAASLTLAGCSAGALANLKKIENETISCAESQLSTLETTLLPSVFMLLTGQVVGWAADLDALVNSFGAAAVCAIQDAVQQAGGGSGSGSGSEAPASVALNPVVTNGQSYINKHGWKITQ